MSSAGSRTPEPPYCWQSKEALRRIREYMQARDQWPKVSSRLSFYLALCEMASNLVSQSFRASQKALADLSGLSDRTQREILRDLQAAGIITASDPENGGQGQKTYTLLSPNAEASSERPEASSECSEVDVNRPQLPTLEITTEEQEKEHREGSSNGSEDRDRNYREGRAHQPADAQPDSQSSSGPLPRNDSAKLKSQSTRPTQLADDVVAAWNEAPRLPRIRNVSDKRKRALAARTKDAFFVEHFRQAIVKISESKFCVGENDRGWKAGFDFFLKPGVIEKVIEGTYDSRPAAVSRKPPKSFI